jgi:hypothetical protein
MANRQIYELGSDTTPSTTDYIPFQYADGSIEANKVTIGDFKVRMRGYRTYMAAVDFQTGPVFDEEQLENDFDGVTYTYDNPSNGTITITASEAIFDANLTFCVSGAINDAGTPYFLTGTRTSDTVCTFKILLHDGTGASTPFFTDVIFEIRVKLD